MLLLLLLLVSEASRPVQLSMGSGMSLGSVEWEPELKPVAGLWSMPPRGCQGRSGAAPCDG